MLPELYLLTNGGRTESKPLWEYRNQIFEIRVSPTRIKSHCLSAKTSGVEGREIREQPENFEEVNRLRNSPSNKQQSPSRFSLHNYITGTVFISFLPCSHKPRVYSFLSWLFFIQLSTQLSTLITRFHAKVINKLSTINSCMLQLHT